MDKNEELISVEKDSHENDVSNLEDVEIKGEGHGPAVSDGESNKHHSHGHHGHSHHSHHHGSKHRKHKGTKKRKNSQKSKKIMQFFKKNRSLLINIFACSLVVVLLLIIAFDRDKGDESTKTQGNSYVADEYGMIGIRVPVYSEEVKLICKPMAEFLSAGDRNAHDVWRDYSGSSFRYDTGTPFEFKYSVVGSKESVGVKTATLEIAENSSYYGAMEYTITKGNVTGIYNLKTNTEYFYRLNLTMSDGAKVGGNGSFKTSNTPRILRIDGIANVRDIGNWTTTDGKKIKQGLLYRGSELDGLVEDKYLLTDEGREEMLVRLGIRYDMDLRSPGDNPNGVNALGESVVHKHFGIQAYSEALKEENNEILRDIFATMADESNYPMYVHCTYGRDRTGTVCHLLEALLGVSDDDLKKEYELSAFSDGFADLEEYAKLTTNIEHFEGNTTKDKVEGYLLSIGVTQEQIESIRKIFLEE